MNIWWVWSINNVFVYIKVYFDVGILFCYSNQSIFEVGSDLVFVSWHWKDLRGSITNKLETTWSFDNKHRHQLRFWEVGTNSTFYTVFLNWNIEEWTVWKYSIVNNVSFYGAVSTMGGADTRPTVYHGRGNPWNERLHTWQLGQLKDRAGFLVSRSLTLLLPLHPEWERAHYS